jgi:hypothetical protein
MAGEMQPAEPCAAGAAKARRRRGSRVAWSDEQAEQLLARLRGGELLFRILREPGMPSPSAIYKWARERPAFAAQFEAARREGGRPLGSRGPVPIFHEGLAEEIFQRVCEGEALTWIGEDPTMPCVWTIFRWRHERPEFETLMQLAMRIRGERAVDRADELVEAATTETAYLTHVQLTHLRWKAGAMAPRVYRVKMSEPEAPQQVRTILFRHFQIEQDPETGKRRVVAYCPNPITGQVEREDTPGWRQAGDASTFALPGGRKAGQGRRTHEPGG